LEQGTEEAMPFNLKAIREQAESQAIKRALVFSHNNITNAAKLLGVTRPTLYTLFDKYGIHINH
jgi:two-component system NtrC family response regulator